VHDGIEPVLRMGIDGEASGCHDGKTTCDNGNQRNRDRYTARALLRERFLALEGEGITWMGQPSRQGIALFSARIEFWRSTGVAEWYSILYVRGFKAC
jgi:hypothetical protein